MWLLTKRKIEFEESLNYLESRLKLYGVHDWSRDCEDFKRLVRIFRKKRRDAGYKLKLVTDAPFLPYKLFKRSYLSVGRVDNPNFEREMEEYKLKIIEHESFKKEIENKINDLHSSEEGKVYEYVISEESKMHCGACNDGYTSLDLTTGCSYCNNGIIDYEPKVNEEQREIFKKIESKILELKEEESSYLRSPKKHYYAYVKIK